MNSFFCRMCGDRIDQWDNSHKLFCSGKCRQKAYRVRKGIESLEKSSKPVISVTGERDDVKVKRYVEVDEYETKTKSKLMF